MSSCSIGNKIKIHWLILFVDECEQWDISRMARCHFQRSRETTFYWQNICLLSFNWFVGHIRLRKMFGFFFAICFFSIGCFYTWINLNPNKPAQFFFFFAFLGGRGDALLQSSEELVNQTRRQLLPLINTAAAAFGWREMGRKRQVSVNLCGSFIGRGNERDENYCLFRKRERAVSSPGYQCARGGKGSWGKKKNPNRSVIPLFHVLAPVFCWHSSPIEKCDALVLHMRGATLSSFRDNFEFLRLGFQQSSRNRHNTNTCKVTTPAWRITWYFRMFYIAYLTQLQHWWLFKRFKAMFNVVTFIFTVVQPELI